MQAMQAPRVNVRQFAGFGSKVLIALLLLPVLLTCAGAEAMPKANADRGGAGGNGGGGLWISVYPSQLAVATVGVAYSAPIHAQGGTAPYKFAYSHGSIPPGLYLNTATGTVAGTDRKSVV